jgi:hypothetical protein
MKLLIMQFSSTSCHSIPSANSYFTDCSTLIIYYPGLVQQAS